MYNVICVYTYDVYHQVLNVRMCLLVTVGLVIAIKMWDSLTSWVEISLVEIGTCSHFRGPSV